MTSMQLISVIAITTMMVIMFVPINGLTHHTLKPPLDEPFRIRAGKAAVVSADHQWSKMKTKESNLRGEEDSESKLHGAEFVIKAGHLWRSQKNKECVDDKMLDYNTDENTDGLSYSEFVDEAVKSMTTIGRSLIQAIDSERSSDADKVQLVNNCLWVAKKTSKLKAETQSGMSEPATFCLSVRKSQLADKLVTFPWPGLPRKYLIWSPVEDKKCEDFYVTSGFNDEKDMFDIFWQSPKSDKYYSPTCCFVSNDNVNVPIVDDGLTMCQCWESEYNDIDQVPVAKKGWGFIKKALH